MTEQQRLAEIERRMREANHIGALVEHRADQAAALTQYPDAARISATIDDCEGCPAMREYHLALDRLTTTHRTAGAT